jgi:hypothetical protein
MSDGVDPLCYLVCDNCGHDITHVYAFPEQIDDRILCVSCLGKEVKVMADKKPVAKKPAAKKPAAKPAKKK